AFERLSTALDERDTDRLTRHLVGRARVEPEAVAPPPPSVVAAPLLEVSTPRARRVAFLGHFLDPADVRDWDPGFASLSDPECERLLDRTKRVLDPFVQHAATVRSALGAAVDVSVIGVPFTSEQVMAGFRAGDVKWARTMIDDALVLAKTRGA